MTNFLIIFRPYPPQNPPSNNRNYLPPSQPDRRYLPSAMGNTNIQNKFDGPDTGNRVFYFDQVVDPSRLKNYRKFLIFSKTLT